MQGLETIVHSTIKEANEKRVLNTAMELRQFTKNELVRQSGVSMTTVSKIVDDYTQKGLFKVIGQGELITAGRKPSLYIFVSDSVFSIGISFRWSSMEFIVVDLDLNPVFNRVVEYELDKLPDPVKYFSEVTAELIKESAVDPKRIAGIGYTFPWMNQITYQMLESSNEFKSGKFVYEGVGIPVIFENRANAAILSEMHDRKIVRGNGVYVSVNVGIDVGVLINGNVFHSRSMSKKSLGHMIIEADGRECRCGSKGCWDCYVSFVAFMEECNKVGLKVSTIDEVVALYQSGNTQAKRVCEDYARMFAVGISNIILAYAPEHIIIGGKLSRVEQWLIPLIKPHLTSEELSKITFCNPDKKSSLMGAAMMPVQKILYMGQLTI